MPSQIGTNVLGIAAPDFITSLPDAIPQVKTFTFVTYEPSPSLAERLTALAAGDSSVLERAGHIRFDTEDVIPYWESVLAAAWASIDFDVFASEACRHDPEASRDTIFKLDADALRRGELRKEAAKLEGDRVIALDSRCTLIDGVEAHLPLMDFRMVPRAGDLGNVVAAVRAVGQRYGVVLKSGRSYHYYGFEPLSKSDWLNFCSRCLLLSPLTDSRYIAHRMLAGAAALRLTASVSKPYTPDVRAIVEPH